MPHQLSDLAIAQGIIPLPIGEIASKLGLDTESIEYFGKYKAKIPLRYIDEQKAKNAKLILVTAITPTPAGEGKTTVSVGLTDGLAKIGKKSLAVLREPSLGPVFGIKGGATGGGYSQVVPMEDINLHFTGDFSAIEKANNLLAALIDNALYSKSKSIAIDPRTVRWKWVMDMNDRSLRHIITGIGGKAGGYLRESGFNITAASEIMAILCLASDLSDLKQKMGNVYIADTYDGQPVYARDLKAEGAMAALLKDAIKPNLVQTIEGNPAILHGGPFANIAQGTNSLLGTKMGMSLADYVVTEAGFGADLGAEKFFNIKCREGNIMPNAVVLVATIRALKYHGGVNKQLLNEPSPEAVALGLPNLSGHIENLRKFGVPIVVAINAFSGDTIKEVEVVSDYCQSIGIPVALSDGWAKGGAGCTDLAAKVAEAANQPSTAKLTYRIDQSIKEKIEAVATGIYGAAAVEYDVQAEADLKRIENLQLQHLPICIAKTQSSFSDDAKLRGRPRGFTFHIREIEIAAGAGFVVPLSGTMLRMPGLPAVPAAEHIDIDHQGNIVGLS